MEYALCRAVCELGFQYHNIQPTELFLYYSRNAFLVVVVCALIFHERTTTLTHPDVVVVVIIGLHRSFQICY